MAFLFVPFVELSDASGVELEVRSVKGESTGMSGSSTASNGAGVATLAGAEALRRGFGRGLVVETIPSVGCETSGAFFSDFFKFLGALRGTGAKPD